VGSPDLVEQRLSHVVVILPEGSAARKSHWRFMTWTRP
jgi:hypothetical protein